MVLSSSVLLSHQIVPIPTYHIIFHRYGIITIIAKPFGIPFEEWSIVNCMLPTTYHPEFKNNIFERLTRKIVQQIHPNIPMSKDYDQLLNKWPGKTDAVFAWHQGEYLLLLSIYTSNQ